LALINVCLGQFITALDSRSVIVALPTISIYFDTSLAVVQWIPLAYQLTIIGLVLSLARLGDMLGRKKSPQKQDGVRPRSSHTTSHRHFSAAALSPA
jgi:MFS family permease